MYYTGFGSISKIIDDAFGIETALMTEIHAVTADQSVLTTHIVIYVVLELQGKILSRPHLVHSAH